MRFEWDPRKNARNLRKHGIAFEDAIKVFDVPHLERADDREYDGEQRWIASGEVAGRVLIVVYTWREDIRRMISARTATEAEREQYYRAIYSR